LDGAGPGLRHARGDAHVPASQYKLPIPHLDGIDLYSERV